LTAEPDACSPAGYCPQLPIQPRLKLLWCGPAPCLMDQGVFLGNQDHLQEASPSLDNSVLRDLAQASMDHSSSQSGAKPPNSVLFVCLGAESRA